MTENGQSAAQPRFSSVLYRLSVSRHRNIGAAAAAALNSASDCSFCCSIKRNSHAGRTNLKREQMSTNAKMNGKRRSDEDQAARGGGSSHAASLGKRQKVTNASLKNDMAEEEDDVLSSILPLRLTVLGGYLPLKDTGRFLLRVSKDMTTSIFEERASLDETGAIAAAEGGTSEAKDATGDGEGVANDVSQANGTEANTTSLRHDITKNDVWKYLCEQKWRSPSTLEHLVSVLGGTGDASAGEMTTDWERLFRKFLPSPPKPAVRASVEDYSFVFSLKKCNVSERDSAIPLTTFVLKGDKASEFLKTGESGWLKLDSPVLLGKFACNRAFQYSWTLQSENMISTLHCLRKSDGRSCELNYQTHLDYTYDEEDRIDFNFSSGSVINVGDLETIILSRNMVDDLGVSIERDLRITALKKWGIVSEYQITHINFSTTLFIESGGYDFNDPSNELATGVTVADFVSRLDVAWK